MTSYHGYLNGYFPACSCAITRSKENNTQIRFHGAAHTIARPIKRDRSVQYRNAKVTANIDA